MADFNLAIDHLLEVEGGSKITKDPNDAGGLTKWGITLADYITHGVDLNKDGKKDAQDLLEMTEEQAKEHYHKNYWDSMLLDSINSQPIANKVFDGGVNLGINGIGKLFQKAIGTVVVDGDIGPNTVKGANLLAPKDLMDKLVNTMTDYYWSITIYNINKKAGLSKDNKGLGWKPEWVVAGLDACNKRDLNAIKELLATIRISNNTKKTNALEGNIRFINGWLNTRANQRFGL